MSDFLNKLQEKVPVREGAEGYRRLLREIYRGGNISIRDLAIVTMMPVSVVAKMVNFLTEKEILARGPEGVLYTENGMQFVEAELKFYGFGISECHSCYGDPIYLSPRWDLTLQMLETIFETRPTTDTTLDQAYATPETSLSRALLLYERGSLEDREVICLGDDDYTSVAIGHLYTGFFPDEPKLIPTALHVVDIDRRLLQGIENVFAQLDLAISTKNWNYKTPVPPFYLQKFDTVLVDPPYSLAGLKLTLSRAIALLKPKQESEIYLSYAHRSPKETFELQRLFQEMGLILSEVYANFNYYEGAQILGGSTQLMRLVLTDEAQPLIAASKNYSEPIYTGELSATIRYYFCKACQKVIPVGRTKEFATIEVLKTQKCPHCQSPGPFELDEKVEE